MTATVDNSEASIPGIIRDPINPYLLRVNSDGSINVTGAGSGTLTSITVGNGLSASANPITTTASIFASVMQPQGRLTLVTGTPVMISDQTAKSTVFYDSYTGNMVPVYDGTNTVPIAIGSDEISLALNTTDNVSGSLYDIFAFSSSGTLTLGTGPAWTNSTTRSAAISLKNGVRTNTASIVLRAGGSSLGTITANKATYLGTIYATANGQTGVAFKPSAASGGTNNFLGVYNAYNRVRINAMCRDSTSSWTYNSTTWRAANASNSARISFVDGLQQSPIWAAYSQVASATTSPATWGVNLDSTSTQPAVVAFTDTASSTAGSAIDEFAPQLGLHFIQAVEALFSGSTDATYNGTNTYQLSALVVSLDM